MDFKVYIAEIGIIILGGLHLYLHGDGEILRLCLIALGILGGVDIAASRLQSE